MSFPGQQTFYCRGGGRAFVHHTALHWSCCMNLEKSHNVWPVADWLIGTGHSAIAFQHRDSFSILLRYGGEDCEPRDPELGHAV